MLLILAYMDRIFERDPSFVISSLTVHRFLVTILTVASKVFDISERIYIFFSDTEIDAMWLQTYSDTYLTNVTYSKVGGLSTHELALLESETLQLLDWELCGTSELLQGYYEKVLRLVRVPFFSHFRGCYSFFFCELL